MVSPAGRRGGRVVVARRGARAPRPAGLLTNAMAVGNKKEERGRETGRRRREPAGRERRCTGRDGVVR